MNARTALVALATILVLLVAGLAPAQAADNTTPPVARSSFLAAGYWTWGTANRPVAVAGGVLGSRTPRKKRTVWVRAVRVAFADGGYLASRPAIKITRVRLEGRYGQTLWRGGRKRLWGDSGRRQWRVGRTASNLSAVIFRFQLVRKNRPNETRNVWVAHIGVLDGRVTIRPRANEVAPPELPAGLNVNLGG